MFPVCWLGFLNSAQPESEPGQQCGSQWGGFVWLWRPGAVSECDTEIQQPTDYDASLVEQLLVFTALLPPVQEAGADGDKVLAGLQAKWEERLGAKYKIIVSIVRLSGSASNLASLRRLPIWQSGENGHSALIYSSAIHPLLESGQRQN